MSSVFASTGSNTPDGLAFDRAGNLYVANNLLVANHWISTIEKFTPGGVGSVFASSGLNAIHGLAFDRDGNLYAANNGDGTIEKFTPGGVSSLFAFTGLNGPFGLAFDRLGNLYATNSADSTIEMFSPAGDDMGVFADAGLSNPQGLAFDSSGNLYEADFGANSILQVAPGIGGAVVSTFASSGLSNPADLAFTNDAGMPLLPEPSIPLLLCVSLPALLTFRYRKTKARLTPEAIGNRYGTTSSDGASGAALDITRGSDSSTAGGIGPCRTRLVRSLLVALGLLNLILPGATRTASAVQFIGTQTAPGQWTYTLTYNPFDNYSIYNSVTTIDLGGLAGVTNATGPSSTDFPQGSGSGLDMLNLAWTPQVLGGGTMVQWSHVGPGTGNFPTDIHVFGFTVTAAGAIDGNVSVSTHGFSTDIGHLPGDANGDGKVGFDDLLILAQNYGKTSAGFPGSPADFNNDGSVGFEDLLVLAQNYGAAAGSGNRDIVASTSGPASLPGVFPLPEPTTSSAVVLMAAAFLRRPGRSRRRAVAPPSSF